MKATIHPTYFADAHIVCSCGNKFTTGSTKNQIMVEVCSNCHPLYTGEKRYIDTLGQVGKFKERQQVASQYKYTKKEKKQGDNTQRPKSLRELLGGI